MKRLIVMMMGLFMISTNAEVEKVFARATKYHKTDKKCDPETKKGYTTTQIKLRDNCDDTIGMVAVDPQHILYGSLVYAPANKRFYLACDRGGDVIGRTAAKNLARKKGLSKKYRDALVLDFYAKHEIINDHFDYFFVIEHEGPEFRHKLSESQQKLRLDPRFWLERAERIYNKGDSDFPDELREIIKKLKQMPHL